jgi:hypothetical protein
MGRTLPTFTNIIDEEIQSWGKFRRALRKEDQAVLDDLFRMPRKHLAECFYSIRPVPFETMILTMLLEEHKLVLQLKKQMEEIKNRHVENR